MVEEKDAANIAIWFSEEDVFTMVVRHQELLKFGIYCH